MYKTNFFFQKKSAFSYAVFRDKAWSRIFVGKNGGFASIGGSKRIGASSFVIDDIAYVVGGENNSDVVADFWAFDPSSGTWTEKREISNVCDEDYDDDYSTIPRSYGVAFAMYGLGYFTCGENAGSGRSNTWEYNPADDTWTERTSFEGGTRTEAVGFSINNNGYVLTWKQSFPGQAFRAEGRHVCIVENTIRQFSCRKCGRDNGSYAIVPPMIS